MKDLQDLLQGVDHERSGAAGQVTGLAFDSRVVKAGDRFFCLRGSERNGHEFAAEALEAGAAAVVVDESVTMDPERPVVRVANVRSSMGRIAARYYDFPSRSTQVIGVTGTNGKTSTTYFASSIFEKAGYPSGVIGTLGYRLGDEWHSASMTTPEAPDLQRYLRHMVDARIKCVVMEVSSHALELHRVEGTEFHSVVFTNLGHDHLDFHGTLENYQRAKERLFMNGEDARGFGGGRTAVINADDPVGRDILARTSLPTVTYAVEGDADVRAESVELRPDSTSLNVRFPDETIPVRLNMPGRVNVYNALAAAATAAASLIPLDRIAQGLESLTHVPGRLESISCGQPFVVVVDYAHNPPALERLLSGVREMTRGRILLVFGCGGDRDRAKRPEMAGLAGRMADRAIVTNDNPRTEDPLVIIGDIEKGFDSGASYDVVPDRRDAIECAIDSAREGDIVVIAGKGHEDYQILGRTWVHFDDRETAREILEKRWGH